MFISRSIPSSWSEGMPNSAARSCTLVLTTLLLRQRPSVSMAARIPAAKSRSRTATVITGGRPRRSPICAAVGPGTTVTDLARARRMTFSAARSDASLATITSLTSPRCNCARVASTPTPNFLLRSPSPSRRSSRSSSSGCRDVVTPGVLFRQLGEEPHQLVRGFLGHAGDLRDLFGLQVDHVVQRCAPGLVEDGRLVGGETLKLRQRDARGLILLVTRQRTEQRTLATALQPLTARVQVDLPAGEFRGKPHVLAGATDRQRELVLVDHGLDGAARHVTEHLGDAGRRERQPREALRVRRPGHDVDALATEFVDDSLHARALEADARADRVDCVVAGDDGDLGPAAGFTRDAADLDDALLDLGHLETEQRLDEHRVGARKDQARSLRGLLDALEHAANRVALVKPLAMILLAIGNDRLGFTEPVQHDHELAALDLLDLAREQFTHLVGELVTNAIALTLPHALDDPLLGGLHRQATERLERHFLFH